MVSLFLGGGGACWKIFIRQQWVLGHEVMNYGRFPFLGKYVYALELFCVFFRGLYSSWVIVSHVGSTCSEHTGALLCVWSALCVESSVEEVVGWHR